MHLDSKLSRKSLRVLAVVVFSTLIAITGYTVAFGDFVPSTSATAKVLGVGRIQSVPLEAPVATDTKFATEHDSSGEEVTTLNAPIARATTEVEAVAPEPEPEPTPAPAPQPQQPASNPASGVAGSEADMLNWIIQRESSGNPYAENGRYKGIGQLQEHHYQIYAGVSWEQAKGNYDIQKKAMLGYIGQRYGTITNAYNFWRANGWY